MKKQTKLGLVLAAAAVISVSVASLVSARGWVQNGADWYYVDNSGEYVTETIQSSGNAKFYLGEDGTMQRDFFLEDYNGNYYYFGQNGAMVTNTWVAIESGAVENKPEYEPDNYWYYFQSSGKAMKASNAGNPKKTTIDGKKYLFNEYGQMLTGWIDDGKTVDPDGDTDNIFADAEYYAGGDNDGVLRAGWVTYYDGYDGDSYASDYTNLYFYFNTSNNTKTTGTKKINGKNYAFNSEGIMLSGWDAAEQLAGSFNNKMVYFSDEDDGHQVKKGWIYAVPAESINSKNYTEEEEKYMYFNAAGEIVKDEFRKISGKYYVFDRTGIMKTGLVMWAPDGVNDGSKTYKYLKTMDLDYATGEEYTKAGIVRYGDGTNETLTLTPDGIVRAGTGLNVTVGTTKVKIHNYGSDGARKTGTNSVEFSDDTYQLWTIASGDKGSGVFGKKYYSLGVLLKANPDIKYGIYHNGTQSDTAGIGEPLMNQYTGSGDPASYWQNIEDAKYTVINTASTKVKANTTAKKDGDGNYWLIGSGDTLQGIWSVNVKSTVTFTSGFTTKTARADDSILNDLIALDDAKVVNTLNGLRASVSNTTAFDELVDNLMDKAVAKDGANTDFDQWVWSVNVDGKFVSLTLGSKNNFKAEGYAFQSDIGTSNSKWIPFGVYDNSKKTVGLINKTATKANKAAQAYEILPNNDYFVNCYWVTLS